MNIEKRVQEQINRLRKMGWTLLCLATLFIVATYFLPNDETNYWLSNNGKRGFFVISILFVFLGLYCLGAIWRRRTFF